MVPVLQKVLDRKFIVVLLTFAVRVNLNIRLCVYLDYSVIQTLN